MNAIARNRAAFVEHAVEVPFRTPSIPRQNRVDWPALEEAAARAHCGQIDDCLHYLGRALPPEMVVIADRLQDALRAAR